MIAKTNSQCEPDHPFAGCENALVLAFVDQLGGPDAYILANARFGDGKSIELIATDMQVSKSKVHRLTNHVWGTCERYGIIPVGWQRHRSKRPKIVYTDKSLSHHRDTRCDRRHNGRAMTVSHDSETGG